MCWIVTACSIAMVTLQGLLAFIDNFFTRKQAIEQGFVGPATPFIAHGGMWGDVFLLSPLLGYVVYTHGQEWSAAEIITCSLLGWLISIGMHRMYAQASDKVPNFLAHNQKLTPAGSIHMIYMAEILCLLLLFFFCSANLHKKEVVWISVILVIHTNLGVVQPALYAGDKLTYPPVRNAIVGSLILIGLIGSYTYFFHAL